MKKLMLCVAVAVCFMVLPLSVQAYSATITDPTNDALGTAFETTSISLNVGTAPLVIDITTAYRLAGVTVGAWQTKPADLLLGQGSGWDYAIPLVSHGSFTAGSLYEIGSLSMSDSFEPATGGPYTYNHNYPVWLETGTPVLNFGGAWSNTTTGISYLSDGWYLGDVFWTIGWGTSTCANDIIEGSTPVPEPTTMLLLGLGLVGLAGLRKKFF